MAINSNMQRVWNWNNFRGGLSDNAYIGQQGSFQNGSCNIDTESEPGGVKLAPAAKDYVTTTGYPTYILDGYKQNVGSVYTFCQDKAIYIGNTLKYAYNSTPSTTMGIIYGAAIMRVSSTPWVFMFSNSAIHKGSQDLNTLSYSVQSIMASAYKTFLIYNDDIYFTSGNVFYKYDKTETLTTIFTAPVSDIFTGITFFQDSFKLYSSVNGVTGRQYIIRVGEVLADYITEWDGLPIQGVANIGSQDYVITGGYSTYTDLYVASGTQRQQIKGNIEGIKGRQFGTTFTASPIISRRDDIYLMGMENSSADGGLYKYGRFYPGIPDALTCPLLMTNELITALAYSGVFIYIGTKSGTTYKVKRMEMSNPPDFESYYATNGNITSLIFDGGNPCNTKILQRIRISYDCDNSATIKKGGSFALYARLKNSQSFTLIGDTYTKTDVGVVDITENIIKESNFENFTQIEYKLVLTAGLLSGNLAYTPLIKSVQTFYYDNITV